MADEQDRESVSQSPEPEQQQQTERSEPPPVQEKERPTPRGMRNRDRRRNRQAAGRPLGSALEQPGELVEGAVGTAGDVVRGAGDTVRAAAGTVADTAKHVEKKVRIKSDIIAFFGEFVGTTMFIFLGLGGIVTSSHSATAAQNETASTISNTQIMFIATSMGFSLLITAWIFYRITGGLFNPAVTLALWLVGAVPPFRAAILVVSQVAGGIAGAALVECLLPLGVGSSITSLEPGVNKAQGLFIEAFLTAMLVFTVLMMAAEKHKATYLAPVAIGLTLFVCQLLGTLWTGCGMNPARAFGPSAITGTWPGYHWIYWVGPLIGSLIAVTIYTALKAFDYTTVVFYQDSDRDVAPPVPVHARILKAGIFKGKDQLDEAERGMADQAIAEHAGEGDPAIGSLSDRRTVDGQGATPMDGEKVDARPTHVERFEAPRQKTTVYGKSADETGVPKPENITMSSAGQDKGGIMEPGTATKGD